MKKIVMVGGGTGTYTVLKGLKQYASEFEISAVVTMADSGGSTGRLRDEFGQLPGVHDWKFWDNSIKEFLEVSEKFVK